MFLQSSHLALIDTLMMAYTVEMVSVERVMSCINRYSSAEPSRGDGHLQELPYDTEDAITTWINKVYTHTHTQTHTQTEAHSCLQKTTETCALSPHRAAAVHILEAWYIGGFLSDTRFFV